MENENLELSEEQARKNRDDFKARLKADGKLENPFEKKATERPKEFHGFQ
jgi:hypothetical protein